ncbi:hypothetical protein, partial [Alicyclobacillus fodiniaquatilis]
SEDVVLDKLILAIRGAPFQLFTPVYEDTIVEIRDKYFGYRKCLLSKTGFGSMFLLELLSGCF